MKKRILSLIITLCIVVGLFSTMPMMVGATSYTEGYYTYTVLNGEVTITSCDLNTSGELIIPDMLGGYPVTSIGDYAFYCCSRLTSIIISDRVATIGGAAFTGCDSLTSVTIPDSVTTIADGAFRGCECLTSFEVGDSNLKYCDIDGILFTKDKKTLVQYAIGRNDVHYTIPYSVTTIGLSAFAWCVSLESITIPNGVTTIGWEAFGSCDSLKSITIPDGVTNIANHTFSCCHSLTSIVIPDSVTTIGNDAFYYCDSLTDVYYVGSKADWQKISIGTYNGYLTTATIHYNSYGADSDEYKLPEIKTGTFQFASEYGNKKGDNGSSVANYIYDDIYFAKSSKNAYNHDLAKMSLRLAMSAFAVHGKGSDKYKSQDTNAKTLLTELGFDEIESKGYTEKPSTNSIGVIAGNKRIAFEDDDYTVIAVAIRGNGYESEWGGNFNVGTGEDHKGFRLARDQVLTFLQSYVRNADISGKIKIWITGFSRAAATANLTAAYLDTHSVILNGTNTDPNKIIEVKPENIYAYCFETPAGTRATDRNHGKYNNIFSIVNQNDFVPMVAPEKWGYGRYGITYYLPTARTNSDYKILVGNMYTYFDEYAGHDYVSWRAPVIEEFDNYKVNWSLEHAYPYYGFYLKEQNSNQTMDDFLQNTIDSLANTFKSPDYYSEHLQDAMVFFGAEIMGQGKGNEFGEIFADEFMSRLNPFKFIFESVDSLSREEKIGLLRGAVKGTFEEMQINISDEAFDGLIELCEALIKDRGLEILLGNLNILPNVHFPELCLAWLDSTLPSKYLYNTRKMCLNCPVDLEVYDSKNNLVAAVYDNKPQEIEDSSIVCYIDANGQKVVYLPTDEEYRVEVIATDDGEVTYTVQEQNADSGTTKVINYNKMAVKKNDTLTGTAENLSETEVATYALASNTVTVDEPEIIESATPITVTPQQEGNGNVSGGGTLYKGEYAQFTATPFENEEFLGWYNGETLVSLDDTYRFQVEEAITLTAKFTENTCEIAFFSTDGDVVVIERILKGNKATFPTFNQNENYVIEDVYTDKELLNLADENAKYSVDTILYLDCAHKNNWVQFDKDNNDIVIYSPKNIDDVAIFVALYKEDKIVEIKPVPNDISEKKNIVDSPITDYSKADTVKIMVWESISNLKPLFINAVTELE